jgi:threonylcarbamoyladenosine tRNA methylthiotransferase MtaB
VQTGCAEPCSYCIIPTTRGTPRSVPLEVSSGSRARRSRGFKEIALTGVHLGSYGRDSDAAVSLVDCCARSTQARLKPARLAHGEREA